MRNLIFVICLLPSLVLAKSIDNEGFPKLYGKVQVRPLSEMRLPQKYVAKALLEIKEQNINGFVKSYSSEAQYLLNIHKTARDQIIKNGIISDPSDTSMKQNISQIRMAYAYRGISFIDTKDIIGFAAQGQWKNGWTGVNEFFTAKALGVCMLSINNVPLTGTSSIVSKEVARYDINKFANTLSIYGSNASGFLYSISWANENFFHDLECANKTYSQTITNDLIQFAKMIEKETSEMTFN